MISISAQLIVEALEEAQAPDVRARLFQWASLRWFEMQPICYRASHLKECGECGKLYIDHPYDPKYPYLNRICNGDLVKL